MKYSNTIKLSTTLVASMALFGCGSSGSTPSADSGSPSTPIVDTQSSLAVASSSATSSEAASSEGVASSQAPLMATADIVATEDFTFSNNQDYTLEISAASDDSVGKRVLIYSKYTVIMNGDVTTEYSDSSVDDVDALNNNTGLEYFPSYSSLIYQNGMSADTLSVEIQLPNDADSLLVELWPLNGDQPIQTIVHKSQRAISL